MQISKTLLTCGAAALCLTAFSAHAKDTATDAQLREALRQKMSEIGGESPAPVAPPAAGAPAPAPATPPASVAPPTVAAPAAQPAVTAPAAQDDAEIARLQQALRDRIAAEGPVTKVVAAPVVEAPAAKPTVSAKPAVQPTVVKPAVTATSKKPVQVPMVAPAPPIAASKEQRLQQLLQQYKADQITPQEYHQQRAAILAE